MQTVPLQAVANQTLQVQLGGQNCTLNIQQMAYGLFMTVYSGPTLVVASVLCQNLNRIVRLAYLGFAGDFAFQDTQGTTDPVYTGLGGSAARYQLLYFSESDLATLGLAA